MDERNKADAPIESVLARVRGLAKFPQRRQEACFWIEGVRSFVAACDAGWPFDTVIYNPLLLQSDLAEKLTRHLARDGVRRVRVTPEQFRGICTLERASGIGAIARQRWMPLHQLEARRGSCVLVIEQIRSPGNLGTILRTANACGVGGVIFVGGSTDPYDPAVVRASMGGLLHLPLVRTELRHLRRWMTSHGVSLIGLSPDGQQLWYDTALKPPVALAVGEERRGLSDALRQLCSCTVRLPMQDGVDSLNVAVAAGVMIYDVVRRRPGGTCDRQSPHHPN